MRAFCAEEDCVVGLYERLIRTETSRKNKSYNIHNIHKKHIDIIFVLIVCPTDLQSDKHLK